MADNNRNWNNQYQQSNNDWDQNRNRFEDEDRSRDDYRYGNTSYGNSNYQNKSMRGGYGGAYSSDYGYQGNNYDQTNWGDRSTDQNWQNSGNQSQQWRNDDRNRRNEGSNYGQTEWRRRDADYGNEYSSHRNAGSDYNHGWNQSRRDYENRNDYNDRYRNLGYGEGLGMTSGYSNRNYGNRNDYGNAGNDRDRGWWDRTRDEVSSWFGDDDAERRRRIDRVTGPHKGTGPRDYQRSEDRIREDVCYRLADDDMVDASDIQVEIKDEEVILTGTVNSREEKRRAEDLVESIYGVRNVENRLRVNRNDKYGFDRYTGTTTDAGGVGRESGTTNEIIRNTGNEKNKNR